jgi:hypothetical protein
LAKILFAWELDLLKQSGLKLTGSRSQNDDTDAVPRVDLQADPLTS